MSLYTLRTRSNDDDQQMVVSSTGEIFSSSVPNGVFNLLSSCMDLEEFRRLHCMIDSRKPSKAHWERNLCQCAHRTELLFNTFMSIEALRWTLFL